MESFSVEQLLWVLGGVSLAAVAGWLMYQHHRRPEQPDTTQQPRPVLTQELGFGARVNDHRAQFAGRDELVSGLTVHTLTGARRSQPARVQSAMAPVPSILNTSQDPVHARDSTGMLLAMTALSMSALQATPCAAPMKEGPDAQAPQDPPQCDGPRTTE